MTNLTTVIDSRQILSRYVKYTEKNGKQQNAHNGEQKTDPNKRQM